MRGFVKYVFKATLNTSHKDKGKKKIVNMKQSTKSKVITTPVSKKVEIWELPMHKDIISLNLLPFLLNFDITHKINQSITSFIIYKN